MKEVNLIMAILSFVAAIWVTTWEKPNWFAFGGNLVAVIVNCVALYMQGRGAV